MKCKCCEQLRPVSVYHLYGGPGGTTRTKEEVGNVFGVIVPPLKVVGAFFLLLFICLKQ